MRKHHTRPHAARGRYVTCECGKRAYETRKDAKLSRGTMGGSAGTGMAAYRCDLAPASMPWHLGHLNKKSKIYGRL
ncbi:hypothetical protein SEA_MOLLYMUR_60 [Gordonia phage Mollymur]|uniref:Uncharacterized protein n=1 Tax=Gordonia phage Mollymur TaxID=2590895 RepID=A0A4Y6E9R8_9CAUD|nr:hypothetical protein PQB84_gp065 [Gordonia phage Mollymur]QDF15421.1 hypothetical protein SEA_MOLLYMUR_60 [Gordonia phage Mollymur]QIG58725.1 hypothetical protein SEA_DATBOI_60 [Gordonia phage DatBoi]